MVFLVALRHDSRVAEVVGYYSLYSVPVGVEVKRPVFYVFSFHNQREYRLKRYPCQPLKKNNLDVDFCVKSDIINPCERETQKAESDG